MSAFRSPTFESAARVRWIDVLVALATAIAQVGGTELFVRVAGSDRSLDPVAYGLLLAGAVPLLVRDWYPRPVLLTVAASTTAYMLLGYPGGFYTIALVLAIWASVSVGHRVASGAVAVALVAIVVVAGFVVPTGHVRDPDAPIWFGGWLARELHDVLTHHISVITIQAGVAVHLLDKRPAGLGASHTTAQARQALVTISESGREAMRELRGILGVLRQVDEVETRAPAPLSRSGPAYG